jgi:hypothetical protein
VKKAEDCGDGEEGDGKKAEPGEEPMGTSGETDAEPGEFEPEEFGASVFEEGPKRGGGERRDGACAEALIEKREAETEESVEGSEDAEEGEGHGAEKVPEP